SLIGAVLRAKREANAAKERIGFSHPSSAYSLREGVEELPKTLAQKLSDKICYHTILKEVQSKGEAGFQVTIKRDNTLQNLKVANLIFCLPAYEVADLLQSLDPALSEPLAKITYPA